MFAILIVYATANAVNLTDGLDGLAAGSSAFVFAAFMIIVFTEFRHPTLLRLRCPPRPRRRSTRRSSRPRCSARAPASCGGTRRPAQIIMGDTGSLAIGGAMAGLALLTRTALLLPILAGLPVVEALSVVAQVISYRGFRRRVLRMAPIHHHFEVGGWSEFTVTVRFWLFAGICVALAIGIFYADFLRIARAGARVTRAVVIGLAETGIAVTRRLRAEGWDVTILEDAPGASAALRGAGRRSDARSARDLVGGAGGRRDRRRGRKRPTSWFRARCVRLDHPALVAGPRARTCRSGARSISPGERAPRADRRGHRHQREDDRHDADRPRC